MITNNAAYIYLTHNPYKIQCKWIPLLNIFLFSIGWDKSNSNVGCSNPNNNKSRTSLHFLSLS